MNDPVPYSPHRFEAAVLRDFGSIRELRCAFSRLAQHCGNQGCIWLFVSPDGTLHLTHSAAEKSLPKGTVLSRCSLTNRTQIIFQHESSEEKALRRWHTIDWQEVSRRYDALMQRLPLYPAP